MKKLYILIFALFVVANVSAQSYWVGDFIEINGKPGVVFEVTSDHKHGKAVGVTQTNCDWKTAVEWCAKQGEGWRLPTKRETVEISIRLDTINRTLKAKGYKILDGWVWSSDEYDEDRAWAVSMVFGDNHCSKTHYYNVRAVTTF